MIYKYIFSVICAGILCGILAQLSDKQGSVSVLIRFLSGLFMTIVLISPLKEIDLSNLIPDNLTVSADADSIIEEGVIRTESSVQLVIKDTVEEYILDKAQKLGAQLSVEVTLDQNKLPVFVTVSGSVSPYAKRVLSEMMQDDLGICKEQQQWT